MTSHSYVNLNNSAPVIEISTETLTRPAPTVQQEHLSDDVFAPQEAHLASAVIGMQLGVGLLHTLAAEANAALSEDEEPPRRRRNCGALRKAVLDSGESPPLDRLRAGLYDTVFATRTNPDRVRT